MNWRSPIQKALDVAVRRGWAQYATEERESGSHDAERGLAVSSADRVWGQGLEYPHTLFNTKTLAIVDRMMTDESVGTFVEMKKSAALSVEWSVEPAVADDPKSVEVAEQTEAALRNVKGSMVEAMAEILTAIENGFSVTNWTTEVMDSGDWGGKLGLHRVKTKPPHNIRFDTDDFLNILPDGIVYTSPDLRIKRLPLDNFIVYTYRKKYGDPYGYGDVIRAYDRWNSKHWINKCWDIHLERFAVGSIVAQYDRNNNPPKAEHAVIKDFVLTKQAKSGISVSQDWEIKALEASGKGGEAFEAAINHRNIAIARAMLLPDLLGFSSAPGGAYALGKKHFDVFLWVLLRLHKDLSEVFNEQLIKPLVDMNYGPQKTGYPTLAFKPLTDEQKVSWLTNMFTAIEKGAIKPDLEIENEVRKRLEIAEKEEDDEARAGGSALPNNSNKGRADGRPSNDDDDGETDPPGEFSYALAAKNRELNQYERKVDFDSLIAFTNESHDVFVESWSDAMQGNLSSMVKHVRKSRMVVDRDFKAVNLLKMSKTREQSASLQRHMVSSSYFGSWQAQQELERARKENFAMPDVFHFEAVQNLPPGEIEAFFESKGLVTSTAIRTAAREAKARAFFVTGVENDKILGQAKQIVYRGIERGDEQWTIGELRKLFDGYLTTGELREGALGQAPRVEIISRNNFTTAINYGRKAQFEDPDVEDFVEAYEWSSVLDDATTGVCRDLDGKVLRKEEVNRFGWPPRHHGCRAIVVPVVQGEVFKFDKLPASAVRAVGFSHRYQDVAIYAA